MTTNPAHSPRPRTVAQRGVRSLVGAVAQRLGGTARIDSEASITGVALDSRSVLPGDLYCALPGAHSHGAEFSEAALGSGAVAILTDEAGAEHARAALARASAGTGVPRPAALVVVDLAVRAWVGPLAAELYGTAERTFPLIGVTGTNGKTTTTYMVTAIEQALGRTTGLIGTIEILAGDEPIPSVLTTPESPDVHAILARMGENAVTAAAMEVSSHAIDYQRVDGIRFDVAGFTNLTQDHLDLHGTMEGYFASKADLFTAERSRRAVVLVQDAWGEAMARHAREHGVAVETLVFAGGDGGTRDGDYVVADVEKAGLGYTFRLALPQRFADAEALTVRVPLPGEFNVANAALAVSLVLAAGASPEELRAPLADGTALDVTVPGRMEVIATSPAAVVDFAHNPDALVQALRALNGDRTVIVFGATGDRDATKRSTMGRIAAEGADVVIVTDDDPHGEDPASIRQAVLDGARAARTGARILEIHPRGAAIREAVRLAGPNDTVLVAGRGHETIQDVAGVAVPLDDRVELAEALRTEGYALKPSAIPAQTTPEGA